MSHASKAIMTMEEMEQLRGQVVRLELSLHGGTVTRYGLVFDEPPGNSGSERPYGYLVAIEVTPEGPRGTGRIIRITHDCLARKQLALFAIEPDEATGKTFYQQPSFR